VIRQSENRYGIIRPVFHFPFDHSALFCAVSGTDQKSIKKWAQNQPPRKSKFSRNNFAFLVFKVLIDLKDQSTLSAVSIYSTAGWYVSQEYFAYKREAHRSTVNLFTFYLYGRKIFCIAYENL
jgi:hypothetical protein